MDCEKSLAQTFVHLQSIYWRSLHDCSPQDALIDEILVKFERLKCLVERADIFSCNESLDDVATSSLPFMLIDAYIASLLASKTDIESRAKILCKANDHIAAFLSLLHNHEICLEYYLMDIKEPAGLGRTSASREEKIRQFKLKSQLKAAFACVLSQDNATNNVPEEILRDKYLQMMEFFCLLLVTEQHPRSMQELEILRCRNELPKDQVSSSVAYINGGGESAELGEAVKLKPIVLLPSGMEARRKVFQPAHNLPTMTIDEYLMQEAMQGNIISKSPAVLGDKILERQARGFLATRPMDYEERLLDQRREEKGEKSEASLILEEQKLETDANIVSLRQQDEFRDMHKRGSGNTYNRS